MLDRVAATIIRHGIFQPGQRVGVAVSGGADSVCLLHVLRELAPRWNLALGVLHLNHQLRGKESDADEDFVRALAREFGLELHAVRADVAGIASGTGDNLEQTARHARRDFFLGFLRQGALDRVALGHTRSDQAETVLFRFLRGAGTAGLSAMRPVTREGLVRPLIEIERPEVESYLTERGIPWREDASNRDLRFARNRIRHELLPALTRDWNPLLVRALARTAALAGDEEDYWEDEISRVTMGQLALTPPAVVFRAGWIAGLPRAVARRVVRRAIQVVRQGTHPVEMEHVERVLELSGAETGGSRIQLPELDVFRSFDWVRLAPAGTYALEKQDYDLPASVPGRVSLPSGTKSLSFEVVQADTGTQRQASEGACVYNGDGTELDWGRISGVLRVRNWRPGDRYRPIGHTCEAKIKSLFQNARVPLWERRGWPVLTCGESIVWAAGFGAAADYAASHETRTVLRVRELGQITEF